MAVDGPLAWSIAEKIALLGVGAMFTWVFERRPRLTVFFAHVGEFRMTPPTPPTGGQQQPSQPITVHTHTIVIRNAGRLAARNIRVPHQGSLARANVHFSVERGVNFQVQNLPGGEEEILFPILLPKQQVTIGYLYFPPVVAPQINLPIRSDEGFAKPLNVLPTPQFSKWLTIVFWSLAVIGLGTLLYMLVEIYFWAGAKAAWF